MKTSTILLLATLPAYALTESEIAKPAEAAAQNDGAGSNGSTDEDDDEGHDYHMRQMGPPGKLHT